MALIADEANVSQEGKLNILGVFDRIASPVFPLVHPKMVFIFRLEARFGQGGKKIPVRVRLMDEDGQVLFEASGEVMAPEVPPGEVATANQIFALVGVQFDRPGAYKFVVNVGETAPYETGLSVVQVPWPQGGRGN